MTGHWPWMSRECTGLVFISASSWPELWSFPEIKDHKATTQMPWHTGCSAASLATSREGLALWWSLLGFSSSD